MFKGASHCGAGCALGDFIGDWLAFLTGLTLFGSELGGKYLAAFVLAALLGSGLTRPGPPSSRAMRSARILQKTHGGYSEYR